MVLSLISFRTAFRHRDFMVRPLQIEDASALVSVHEHGFNRPWSEEEFASLMTDRGVLGFGVVEVGVRNGPLHGFVLARQVLDEAEILTVVVPIKMRRRGLGRMLMEAVLRQLHGDRIQSLFLEVDETNAAARTLYERLGFEVVGHRPNYYQHSEHGRTGALVMRKGVVTRR